MVESLRLGVVSPRTERGQQTVDRTPFPCCSLTVKGGKAGGLWDFALQGSERFAGRGLYVTDWEVCQV